MKFITCPTASGRHFDHQPKVVIYCRIVDYMYLCDLKLMNTLTRLFERFDLCHTIYSVIKVDGQSSNISKKKRSVL